MKKIIVIGLGLFGRSLAKQLAQAGAEVIATDIDMQAVERIKDKVAYAMRLDARDEEALQHVEIQEMDIGVAAIGGSFETNLLVAINLKHLGVPRVIARASTPMHKRILTAVGIDEIINPEEEAATRLTSTIFQQSMIEAIPLGHGYTCGKVVAPAGFVGHSLKELDVRRQYGLTVIAIYRSGSDGKVKEMTNPGPEEIIQAQDQLYIIGAIRDIENLPE